MKHRVVQTIALLLMIFLVGCSEKVRTPVILFGVDGAEWQFIEWMWRQDRLPNLKALAEGGVSAPLETFHHASPVIWTTVATGVYPKVHGITEFVVPTGKGDLPVASTMRRTPALWNMLSAVGYRVAVAGWWASWPAEDVNGVVISDRAIHPIEDRVSPASFEPRLEILLGTARDSDNEIGNDSMLLADRLNIHSGLELLGEGYDLTMIYIRGTDIASHFNWRYFEPEGFPTASSEAINEGREKIAREYELVDRTIGALVRRTGARSNLIVMSDHGFTAMAEEELRVPLDMDVVLQHLGFLEKDSEGVDMTTSSLYTHASPLRMLEKKIRFNEAVVTTARQRASLRRQLLEELRHISYTGGHPALRLRDANEQESRGGADLVVEVLPEGAHAPLRQAGKPIRGALKKISRLSGTHGKRNPGIFIAGGPDIKAGTTPDDLRVIDVAPTVLHALGLPAADNFAGRVREEIFTHAFRSTHAVRRIPTWGQPRDGEQRSSKVDEQLVDELRALGYIEPKMSDSGG